MESDTDCILLKHAENHVSDNIKYKQSVSLEILEEANHFDTEHKTDELTHSKISQTSNVKQKPKENNLVDTNKRSIFEITVYTIETTTRLSDSVNKDIKRKTHPVRGIEIRDLSKSNKQKLLL
ncbi:hypothetical protein CDIK_2734 [Cucumispora dikerogammari]|nr:hypothetical protein CDIK_2734 [Cucumispora dikerogammari]